jgi:uncharacterized protein
MRRGEKEGFISFQLAPPEEEALASLEALFVKGTGADSAQVRLAVQDGYKRLLSLSIETETRLATKKRAETEAIRVFAGDPAPAAAAPPLGAKNVLAIARLSHRLKSRAGPQRQAAADDTIPHDVRGRKRMPRPQVRELCASMKSR